MEEIILNVIYAKTMLMLVLFVYVIWDIIWIQHIIVLSVIIHAESVQVVVHIVQIVIIHIEH